MAFDNTEVTYEANKIKTTVGRGRPQKLDKKKSTSINITFNQETFERVERYAALSKTTRSRVAANSTEVSPFMYLTPFELGDLEVLAKEQNKPVGQLIAELVKEKLNDKEEA